MTYYNVKKSLILLAFVLFSCSEMQTCPQNPWNPSAEVYCKNLTCCQRTSDNTVVCTEDESYRDYAISLDIYRF